ncbi:MAG: Spy/CpxP family protein refolding chaperone [Methylovirgula sp.]
MTPRLRIAIAVISLVGTGFLSTTFTAKAQETPPEADGAAAGEHHHFKLSPEDRAAFLTARIAALHAGLELTPDQDKLWPPVETALRDFSKLVAAEREKFHDEKHPRDPVARVRLRGDNLIARGQALKKIADAAAPLYAALTDAQKHRLPILLHAIYHPFMHHHFMMGHGMMGHGMMDHGMMGRDDQDGGADSEGQDKD